MNETKILQVEDELGVITPQTIITIRRDGDSTMIQVTCNAFVKEEDFTKLAGKSTLPSVVWT